MGSHNEEIVLMTAFKLLELCTPVGGCNLGLYHGGYVCWRAVSLAIASLEDETYQAQEFESAHTSCKL